MLCLLTIFLLLHILLSTLQKVTMKTIMIPLRDLMIKQYSQEILNLYFKKSFIVIQIQNYFQMKQK